MWVLMGDVGEGVCLVRIEMEMWMGLLMENWVVDGDLTWDGDVDGGVDGNGDALTSKLSLDLC